MNLFSHPSKFSRMLAERVKFTFISAKYNQVASPPYVVFAEAIRSWITLILNEDESVYDFNNVPLLTCKELPNGEKKFCKLRYQTQTF
jgi:hypothetical protein